MIYAVGDNPVASRLAGVRVWQVLLFVYALVRRCSRRSAAILLVGFNNAADLGIAAPFLLPVGRGGRDRRHVDLRRLRRLRGHDPRRADPDACSTRC